MAQHDYVIGNDDGASVRADVNDVLAAIKSGNSHASTSPASPVAGMFWVKTVSGTVQELYQYDGANWILLGTINPTAHTWSPVGGIIGLQSKWIPAREWAPTITNGARRHLSELATNDIMLDALLFDKTTQQFATVDWTPPKKWNGGTVAFAPYWTSLAGSAAENAVFELKGVAISNADALDAAPGTGQTSDDALIAIGDLHIGPTSAAITIAGTPADADMVSCKIQRNVASDNLNDDAYLIGVMLFYTVDAGTDA